MADDGEQLDDLECELRRVRLDIQAMVMSFAEPSTAFKIEKEYEADNGPLDYRKFGYSRLSQLLDDHPRLYQVTTTDGRLAYKAKASENAAARAIQSLVSRQKGKKRKNGRGKRGRGGGTYSGFVRSASMRPPKMNPPPFFDRNVPARASHGLFGTTSTFGSYNYASTRGRGRGGRGNIFTRVDFDQRTSSEHSNSSSNRQSLMSTPSHLAASRSRSANVPSARRRISSPVKQDSPSAEKGTERMLQVLNAMGGAARLQSFARRYKEKFSTDFDRQELQRYFGATFLSEIRGYVEDKIVFLVLGENQVLLQTREFYEAQQRAGDDSKESATIRRDVKPPTLVELYNNITAQLIDMFPAPMPIERVSVYYERFYEVEIDPVKLFRRTWEDLFSTTFRDRTVVREGKIGLNERFVADKKIVRRDRQQSGTWTSSVDAKLNEINDLRNDDFGDSSQDSQDETDSQCSNSIIGSSDAQNSEWNETENVDPSFDMTEGSHTVDSSNYLQVNGEDLIDHAGKSPARLQQESPREKPGECEGWDEARAGSPDEFMTSPLPSELRQVTQEKKSRLNFFTRATSGILSLRKGTRLRNNSECAQPEAAKLEGTIHPSFNRNDGQTSKLNILRMFGRNRLQSKMNNDNPLLDGARVPPPTPSTPTQVETGGVRSPKICNDNGLNSLQLRTPITSRETLAHEEELLAQKEELLAAVAFDPKGVILKNAASRRRALAASGVTPKVKETTRTVTSLQSVFPTVSLETRPVPTTRTNCFASPFDLGSSATEDDEASDVRLGLRSPVIATDEEKASCDVLVQSVRKEQSNTAEDLDVTLSHITIGASTPAVKDSIGMSHSSNEAAENTSEFRRLSALRSSGGALRAARLRLQRDVRRHEEMQLHMAAESGALSTKSTAARSILPRPPPFLPQ